jgi:PEP-CTERM motif
MLSKSDTAKIMLGTAVVTLVALTLLVGSASANSIDFAGGKGGSMTFTPALGNTLDVIGAPIDFLRQSPSFIKYLITGGTIDITTGACFKGCIINPTAHTTNADFADGGLIEIFGSVPSLPGDPSGLLMEGVFNSSLSEKIFGHVVCPTTHATLNAVTGGVSMSGCVQVTALNQTLLTDLGFGPTNSGDSFLSEMFFSVTLNSGTFTGEVLHTDVNVEPLPEPATLALLGAGFLAIGTLCRKRLLARLGAR